MASYVSRGPYICIAPTSVWFTKQFPEEQWLKLLRALPPHYSVYLLGAPPTAPCVSACARKAAGRAS
nr:glycosyltransferase family 9 protein [Hymenobacter radiodurans]